MNYQVSIEIYLRSSGPIKKLLHSHGFRIFLKNSYTGDLQSDDEKLDAAVNTEKDSGMYYWYCIYNSANAFPPQEVLQQVAKHPSLKKLTIHYTND
ncbi:hypothetical protein IJS18_02030 [Candidatus Saccharibacteria bacterium]|nr:hypothetical protein [Candidatus Saccharibacteria bacterium]